MEFDVKRTYIVKQKWKAEALGGPPSLMGEIKTIKSGISSLR
jgi:hypothetical protein